MILNETILDYREPEWVAERLGVEKNTVYKFLQDGTIPAVQLGRKWLVSEARLAEWLKEETENQTRARREAAGAAERTVQRMDDLTPSARRAIKQAHSEARRYNHPLLGPEHLLLGLSADPRTRSARALAMLSVDAQVIREHLESRVPPRTTAVPRRLGRSADAKQAMRLAAKLARRDAQRSVGDGRVGTHHLLLGVLLARRGVGSEILRTINVTHQRLVQAVDQSRSAEDPTSKGETHGN